MKTTRSFLASSFVISFAALIGCTSESPESDSSTSNLGTTSEGSVSPGSVEIAGKMLGWELTAKSAFFTETTDEAGRYQMGIVLTDAPNYCEARMKDSVSFKNQQGIYIRLTANADSKERPKANVEYASWTRNGFFLQASYMHLDTSCRTVDNEQLKTAIAKGALTFTSVEEGRISGSFQLRFEDTVDVANGTASGEFRGKFSIPHCDVKNANNDRARCL